MKKNLTTILFLLTFTYTLLVSCNEPSFEKLINLSGKTESELVENFGTETRSNIIILSTNNPLGEKYVTIYNTYRPEKPETNGIEIKELEWKKGNYTICVFLHKQNGTWTVLDAFKYKDGVQF